MKSEELLFNIDQLRIKYKGQKIDIEEGSKYINEAIELIEQFKKEIIEKKEVKTKWSVIKCFFGFHEPSSTSEASTWQHKAWSICIHCKKKYRVKYPEV